MPKTNIAVRFDTEKLENAAYVLKAVVHPIRLGIIDLLDQYKEMSVTDFSQVLEISHALTSHHLNDMRSKNILQQRREGRKIYYSIREKSVLGLLKCIQHCEHH